MSSTTMQAAERLVVASDFVQAVRRSEWDRADRLWPELGGMLGDDCWSAAATLHMQRERWAEAAETLSRLRQPDAQQKLHLTLCRNLAALKAHRPEIYRVIADADVGQTYRIDTTPSGAPTLLMNRPDGKTASLRAGTDPVKAAEQVREQLKEAIGRGQALALLSIGDGHVVDVLVRKSPVLFLGRRQAIFLIEPDPRLVLATMLIHDFTGPEGPIEAGHVQWYVGPRWAEQFRLAILTDRYLPFPQMTVKLGLEPKPIELVLQGVLEDLGQIDQQSQQEINRYYGALPADHFAQVLAGQAARPPRVLLLTTKFSTVLQYSTRDAADAFRQLGWEAHVMIEPSLHHGLTRVGMRRTVAEVKPDVIFQIDHNRFEHADLFPPNVPFVNWIQDLLPHLMKPQTGRQMSIRDFALVPSLQRWVDEYTYPARQCMEFRKLTRIPDRPLSWSSRPQQVVYVSNWSQSPQQIRDELTRGAEGKTRDVLDIACQRMIDTYAAGGSLPTQGDVRRLLIEVMRQADVTAEEGLVRHTTTRLFDRMNNLLFRQQGLAWAIASCELLGLELQIYGNGWDKNPPFAQYARGPIGYGDDLEDLTRQAGVNLVLEPFASIAHQRVLDALAAGGFCLIRNSPGNTILQRLLDLLAKAGPSATSRQTIRAILQQTRDEALLDAVLADCDRIESTPGYDHIANTRRLVDSGFLAIEEPLLPLFDQVTFDTPDQLKMLLTRCTRDDALRATIARKQREAVESRYSYTAGIRRMVDFLASRLANEPSAFGKAA